MLKFYLTITFIISIYLVVEYYLLSISIRKIPLRILVNGTRGKSTTVKIIYNILQKNGYKVYAKITGNNPILFNHDGTKKLLKRFAPISIKENIRLLRQIAKEKSDAMVMECMALQSETQKILSKIIFKPHYAIIVNVLPDHQEIMGDTIEENLLTLLECVNKNSTLLVTSETNNILKNVNCTHNKVSIVSQTEFNFDFKNIPKEIISESWSIINGITKELNLDKQIARDQFLFEWQTIDKNIKLEIPKLNIEIWNLFSVNDIVTTKRFIQFSTNVKPKNDVGFILNCRMDRPLRTKEFAQYISDNFKTSKILLMGNGKYLAKNIFKKNNFSKDNIVMFKEDRTIMNIEQIITKNSTFYSIGNNKGTEKLQMAIMNFTTRMGVAK
ncbi:MAG: hypothetical protein L3J41_10830 [Melioribacteraceae bacterium]|nr:hypothetical protein [Melioribacteraceae bacterium]